MQRRVSGREDRFGHATVAEAGPSAIMGGDGAQSSLGKIEGKAASPPKRRLFYAVSSGHKIGIWETWAEAELQIKVNRVLLLLITK